MKCPHCGYINGWDADSMNTIKGSEGYFYCLPIKMEKEAGWETTRKEVYGCPSCNKIFMGD